MDTQKNYTITYIDGSTCVFENLNYLLKWNHILYDFKPWFSYKNKSLYRTKKFWIVKNNNDSSSLVAIKYKNLFFAIKELFYFTNLLT